MGLLACKETRIGTKINQEQKKGINIDYNLLHGQFVHTQLKGVRLSDAALILDNIFYCFMNCQSNSFSTSIISSYHDKRAADVRTT